MEQTPLSLPQGSVPGLVYRHSAWTRATHWVWAICLFFLLLSGLQIFNAHPMLYTGDQSGFAFDNTIFAITAGDTDAGPAGFAELLGRRFDTTGMLGLSDYAGQPQRRAFPGWATLPSYQDLATGRVVHFFFAWVFVFALAVWLGASLINGHFRRDLVPRMSDLRRLPRDLLEHVRFRLHRSTDYNTLQKLSYAVVLLVFFPLMILTGLAMSPGMNAALPMLPELFGGRQTARTIHFLLMLLLGVFVIVHVLMVLVAGPVNELRSMLTGWYRADPPARTEV